MPIMYYNKISYVTLKLLKLRCELGVFGIVPIIIIMVLPFMFCVNKVVLIQERLKENEQKVEVGKNANRNALRTIFG